MEHIENFRAHKIQGGKPGKYRPPLPGPAEPIKIGWKKEEIPTNEADLNEELTNRAYEMWGPRTEGAVSLARMKKYGKGNKGGKFPLGEHFPPNLGGAETRPCSPSDDVPGTSAQARLNLQVRSMLRQPTKRTTKEESKKEPNKETQPLNSAMLRSEATSSIRSRVKANQAKRERDAKRDYGPPKLPPKQADKPMSAPNRSRPQTIPVPPRVKTAENVKYRNALEEDSPKESRPKPKVKRILSPDEIPIFPEEDPKKVTLKKGSSGDKTPRPSSKKRTVPSSKVSAGATTDPSSSKSKKWKSKVVEEDQATKDFFAKYSYVPRIPPKKLLKMKRKSKRKEKKVIPPPEKDLEAEKKRERDLARQRMFGRKSCRLISSILRKPVKPRKMPRLRIPDMPRRGPYNPLDTDPIREMGQSEQVDRGQRLKNLLMNKDQLKKQQKLTHLVPPEDPLCAVYLPKLERLIPVEEPDTDDQTKLEKELQLDLGSRKKNNKKKSAQSTRKGPSTRWETGRCSVIRWPDKSFASCLEVAPPLTPIDSESFFSCTEEQPKREIPKIPKLPKKKCPAEFSSTEDTKRRMQGKGGSRNKPVAGLPRGLTGNADFRTYFELDTASLQTLIWLAKLRAKERIEGHARIKHYMEHFYWERLIKDGLYFHWFIYEGFYPIHYLTQVRTAKELDGIGNPEIDALIVEYVREKNRGGGGQEAIELTPEMAYFMVSTYFRILYDRVCQKKRPMEERFMLRCRFAVCMVEVHLQELRRRPCKGRLNCQRLLEWALLHENRISSILDESLAYAEERAGLRSTQTMVVRTPNLEAFKDFYDRQMLPRPDALAVNPGGGSIQRYPCTDVSHKQSFTCPIQGCLGGLNSLVMMSHFLTDHCRRMEELWLKDRMILFFHPSCYPPEQLYCICVVALMGRPPSPVIPFPKRIINAELPSRYLYFSEHVPCMVMYCQVSKSSVCQKEDQPKVQDQPVILEDQAVNLEDQPVNEEEEDQDKDKNKPVTQTQTQTQPGDDSQLYVFWLATSDEDYPHVGCRMYIYCPDRSIKGSSLIKLVRLSQFKGIVDLIKNHPDSYLAVDQDTMVNLTKNFKELLFIDVRYVDPPNYNEEQSEDEMWGL
ncbi:hypothetical protein KR009_002253 [Drosophila setifemur]|nr:hypothetical protein KR009_002253 [Drosophila setifemur]